MKSSNCKICGIEVFSNNGRKGCCKNCVKIRKKEYDKEYVNKPEIKVRRKRLQRQYNQRPEIKAKVKENNKRPEVIARRKRNFQKPERQAHRKEYLEKIETKEMRRKWYQEYNIKNREALKFKAKEYRRNNKEKEQKYFREYYQRPETKARLKKYYEENQQRISKRGKEYNQRPEVKDRRKEHSKSPEARSKRKEYYKRPEVIIRVKEYNKQPKRRQKAKEYRSTSEYKVKEKQYTKQYNQIPKNKKRKKEWTINQWHTNSHYRIKSLIRHRFYLLLSNYLKKKKLKPCKEYGVDYLAIMEHLKPFPKDMHLYHIDHIRPLKSFNFINEDDSINLKEIQLAFAPENHQWLLATDNLIKGGRWEKQSLLIAK